MMRSPWVWLSIFALAASTTAQPQQQQQQQPQQQGNATELQPRGDDVGTMLGWGDAYGDRAEVVLKHGNHPCKRIHSFEWVKFQTEIWVERYECTIMFYASEFCNTLDGVTIKAMEREFVAGYGQSQVQYLLRPARRYSYSCIQAG